MTLAEIRAKWQERRSDPLRSAAMVPLEAVCVEALADLQQLADDSRDSVTFKEASMIGGYSVDDLQRLVAAGTLENVGRKHRPRIRRSDLPTKPGHVPPPAERHQYSARRRIVSSVVTGSEEVP